MLSRCLIWLAGLGLAAAAQAAPWTQEIYVWQREANPTLAAALTAARPLTDGFHVLAAEVAWTGAQPRIFRPKLDYAQLAALHRPIGLVLRIGAYAGPVATDDAAAKNLIQLAKSVLDDARARGLAPAELQIDFDSAESKLADYALWLKALRTVTAETPLVFTALPVWLAHGEFAMLARLADGFVLQVHSLEKPAGPDAPFVLCDPARARGWIEQASRVGVPFRVALPTYGYLLAFDAAGKFFALAAEGPRPAWPADTQVRLVRADAAAMAEFAQSLARQPAPHCRGVIWFRLPIASDRLNWDWTTLATVLKGAVPASRLELAVAWTQPGLAEIAVINTGQTTEPLPALVAVRWSEGARPLATDGLGGFRVESHPASDHANFTAANLAPDTLVAPGHRARIGWLRFPHEISLTATLPSPPP